MMLPKERVIAAIEHRASDRIPLGEIGVDFSITDEALGYETLYRAKWREYQAYWQGRRNEVVESYKRDIVALARKFEWDFVPAPLISPLKTNYEQPEFIDEYHWRNTDGSEWIYSPITKGHAMRVKFPEMTINNIPQPKPIDESELEVAIHIIKELGGSHFILGRPATDGTFPYSESVGLQEFLIRMVTDPYFVTQAISVYTQRTIIEQNALLDLGCDAVLLDADYCGTKGPMMSPEHFRQFVFPALKYLCDEAHARGKYLIKHTDGSTWAILPEMIESGINGWHGIQPSIGMDIAKLKKMYGTKLCFFGGVDCNTLVSGTQDDVRKEVRDVVQYAGKEGGLVLTSSNTLTFGVKYDNYLVMIETARET